MGIVEGLQDIIIHYNIYYVRVYPSEIEISDCIRLGVFSFLSNILSLLIATKKKNASAGFGSAGVNERVEV